MTWDESLLEARAWLAYVGTARADGRLHVAPVSPGFTEDAIWFVTRTILGRDFHRSVYRP